METVRFAFLPLLSALTLGFQSASPPPELVRAAGRYRKAGFYWEAKDFATRVPDDQNAAPLIAAALRAYTLNPQRIAMMGSRLAQGNFADANSVLRPYQRTLNFARQASQKPHLDFKRDWDQGITLRLAETFPMKDLVKLLCISSMAQIGSGKVETGLEDFRAARKLSLLLVADTTEISLLIQNALDAITLAWAETIAATLKSNPTALRKLEESIEETQPHPKIAKVIKTEAYLILASLRNLDARTWSSDNVDQVPKFKIPGRILRTGYPSDGASQRLMKEMMLAYSELARELPIVDKDPSRMERTMKRAAVQLRSDKDKPILSSLGSVFPLLKREAAQTLCCEALIDALILRNKTGKFPTSISAIRGPWIDPFDGKHLKLKATPTEIRIYSVGPDLQDNGGISQHELPMFAQKGWDIVSAYPPIQFRNEGKRQQGAGLRQGLGLMKPGAHGRTMNP